MKLELNEVNNKNGNYINELKEKNEIINKLEEEYNLYKNDSEKNKNELNQIISNETEKNKDIIKKNKELQNEIDQIKEKLNAKEKQNKELIDNMKKEAIDAKVKLADSNYENDKKYMKLKKQFEKLLSALESFGVTVKEIK